MIYWKGKEYRLVTRHYNGDVLGYLLDGIFHTTRPKRGKVRGHITTEEGVLIVLRRDPSVLLIASTILLIAAAIVLWPRQETIYYQATFSASPLFSEGVLYCNVVNESTRNTTVQFLSDHSKSIVYALNPEETLPRVYIDFVPTVIRYNGNYDFPLEVRSD